MRGAHHTPAAVAAGLVDRALDGWSLDGEAPVVADLAVGGGAFLLAAARALVARGLAPSEVVAGCRGVDVDPIAVATTRVALAWFAADHGVPVDAAETPAALVVGDGLDLPASLARPAGGFDLVVGNPPFLSQLAVGTARDEARRAQARARLGGRAAGYVDDAGLFLLAAVDATRPGGRVALVLPEPLLSSRDGRAVRDAVTAAGWLVHLWVAGEPVFEADVRVWAPVIEVGARMQPGPVPVSRGPTFGAVGSVPAPGPGEVWTDAVAAVHGTPAVPHPPSSTGRLGDIATATAGFRQQFYGLAPHVAEADGDGDHRPSLVTSGAIDPHHRAGLERPVRFAKRRWSRPVVDVDAVEVADPVLGRWVRARLVPKVLVATQTRVVEAVADRSGTWVPSTPVLSVEPADPGDLWRVLALLLAPPVSAWALRAAAGAALTADAIKLSSRQLLDLPLPGAAAPWAAAAAGLAAGTVDARDLGVAMLAAYGLEPDHPVLSWWLARLPSWAGAPVG